MLNDLKDRLEQVEAGLHEIASWRKERGTVIVDHDGRGKLSKSVSEIRTAGRHTIRETHVIRRDARGNAKGAEIEREYLD